jgi:hypothetical protein
MECFLKVLKYGSGVVIETVFKIALCPSGQEGIFFPAKLQYLCLLFRSYTLYCTKFYSVFFTRLKESPSVYDLALRSLSCFKWNTPLRIQELLLFREDLSKRDY